MRGTLQGFTFMVGKLAILTGVAMSLASCGGGGSPTDDDPDPQVGSIRVSSNTAGKDLDVDGYTVWVDGSVSQAIGAIGSVTFADVSVGNHTVELRGFAANCTVDGSNPIGVPVSQATMANATFDVTCVSTTTGAIDVHTHTVGVDLDSDGYRVSLDGAAPRPIWLNNVSTFINVQAGDHEILISDIASNCSLSGDANVPVSVTAGSTSEVRFDVECEALPRGTLVISASTTNNLDPDGFDVEVGGDSIATVPVNGTVTIDGVVAGEREVLLTDLAPNCSVEGQNPRTTTISTGESITESYTVNCVDPPEGRILFIRRHSGEMHVSAMNADGSGVFDLLEDIPGSYARSLSISHDGERIAFSVLSGPQNLPKLFLMNKDASGITPLTAQQDEWEIEPTLTQDGSRVSFASERAVSGEIWVAASDGSGLTQLTDHPTYSSFSPTWSPDGSKLAFSQETKWGFLESIARIYVMKPDGTERVALTENPPICPSGYNAGNPRWGDYYPEWSPDGSKILFFRQFDCDDDPANDYIGLFVMDPDGTNPVELVKGAIEAAWSPDGTRIVFRMIDGDHIHVMNADGSDQTLLLGTGAGNGDRFSSLAWGG